MELQVGSGSAARLIAQTGALETPFVLIDIGVRDGIHPRWKPLETVMEVYGFDAIAEVRSPNERHRYFKLAVGDFDGECRFDVPENLYEARLSATGTVAVPMAKLDTLLANRLVPTADFIKIDCEGHEPDILRGAKQYLAACNLLAADIETNFNISPTLPKTHFAAIAEPLLNERLLVTDLAFDSASFPSNQPWPGTCNALFVRNFINERDHQENYQMRRPEALPSADAILKTIAVFDLYSLNGPARALLTRFQELIEHRVDTGLLMKSLDAIRKDFSIHNGSLTKPAAGVRSYGFEKFLPHLGLGLWSGVKRSLRLR